MQTVSLNWRFRCMVHHFMISKPVKVVLLPDWIFLVWMCFVVWMVFYCWIWLPDMSGTRISRVPLWHPRGKFFTGQKQNGRQPNLLNPITPLFLVIEGQPLCLNLCFWGQIIQLWSKKYWYPDSLSQNPVIWGVIVSIGVKYLWNLRTPPFFVILHQSWCLTLCFLGPGIQLW